VSTLCAVLAGAAVLAAVSAHRSGVDLGPVPGAGVPYTTPAPVTGPDPDQVIPAPRPVLALPAPAPAPAPAQRPAGEMSRPGWSPAGPAPAPLSSVTRTGASPVHAVAGLVPGLVAGAAHPVAPVLDTLGGRSLGALQADGGRDLSAVVALPRTAVGTWAALSVAGARPGLASAWGTVLTAVARAATGMAPAATRLPWPVPSRYVVGASTWPSIAATSASSSTTALRAWPSGIA
jgi:hypothetical protein